jgi:hypothetical protein
MARAAVDPTPRMVATRCPGTVLFLLITVITVGFDKRSGRARVVMVIQDTSEVRPRECDPSHLKWVLFRGNSVFPLSQNRSKGE